MKETRTYTVTGLVQGIGFRPFAAELAKSLGVTGRVRNTSGIVTILATGTPEQLERFAELLDQRKPNGARVDSIAFERLALQEFAEFVIDESEHGLETEIPYLPADLTTCPVCFAELSDRSDRRYRHPFISCTACGPRYSIMEKLPYDRDHITMLDFPMCEECRSEYQQQGNRRRHAQTIACHCCGPKLRLKYLNRNTPLQLSEHGSCLHSSEKAAASAIAAAGQLLRTGGILAIKDIGGYHLACLPTDERAAAALRKLKGRDKKPFAVLFAGAAQVKSYAAVSAAEELLLTSNARPIVLLKKLPAAKTAESFLPFAQTICGNSPDIGAMLPCNPVQSMLLEECGPLVMTSANRSGELMIIDNSRMEAWMREGQELLTGEGTELPLGILSHDRRIMTPLDDSIFRVVKGRTQVLRRARGIVPEPILLPEEKQKQLLAAGGDLKSCFCYVYRNRAYLSQPFGDLGDEEAAGAYQKEMCRMRKLFGFMPEEFVSDMHPSYQSVRLMETAACECGGKLHQVQHHHAHIASVLAEHRLSGAVMGVAFDGTGYGTNHTVWGSEFFVFHDKKQSIIRAAHLKPVQLPGGNEGAKNADSILYGYLASLSAAFDGQRLRQLPWLSEERLRLVGAAAKYQVNTIASCSMGRLFDAVSALLDICHYNSYEGEAAIELEYSAGKARHPYPLTITVRPVQTTCIGDPESLFLQLLDGLEQGISRADLAMGFILAVSRMIEEICDYFAVKQVALSGGTFLNRLLLESVIERLEEKEYQVYINEQVPPGDGGISLGQLYLA